MFYFFRLSRDPLATAANCVDADHVGGHSNVVARD